MFFVLLSLQSFGQGELKIGIETEVTSNLSYNSRDQMYFLDADEDKIIVLDYNGHLQQSSPVVIYYHQSSTVSIFDRKTLELKSSITFTSGTDFEFIDAKIIKGEVILITANGGQVYFSTAKDIKNKRKLFAFEKEIKPHYYFRKKGDYRNRKNPNSPILTYLGKESNKFQLKSNHDNFIHPYADYMNIKKVNQSIEITRFDKNEKYIYANEKFNKSAFANKFLMENMIKGEQEFIRPWFGARTDLDFYLSKNNVLGEQPIFVFESKGNLQIESDIKYDFGFWTNTDNVRGFIGIYLEDGKLFSQKIAFDFASKKVEIVETFPVKESKQSKDLITKLKSTNRLQLLDGGLRSLSNGDFHFLFVGYGAKGRMGVESKTFNFIFNKTGEVKSIFVNPNTYKTNLVESSQKTFMFNEDEIFEYKNGVYTSLFLFEDKIKKMSLLSGTYYVYENKGEKKLYSIAYKKKKIKLLEIDLNKL